MGGAARRALWEGERRQRGSQRDLTQGIGTGSCGGRELVLNEDSLLASRESSAFTPGSHL